MGIDAGSTVAFAALGFDGRLVAKGSKRNLGSETLIRILSNYDPVIIATDTNPPNKLSRAVATAFNARLAYPKHSLTVLEKSRITRDYSCKNAHEKDALAAALKAFHQIENKMRQAGRRAREDGLLSWPAVESGLARVAAGTRMTDAV